MSAAVALRAPGSAPCPQALPGATAEAGGALGYLVSRYPAVSHTFILREVRRLRALGLRIEVASVNEPDREPQRMTPEEQSEAAATYGLKRHGLRGAVLALGWALATRPLSLWRTLREATAFGRGLRRIYALAYAVEAVMVARWMRSHELGHLHVHFGNEAAAVGVLVRTFAGVGLSMTIHGPDEFDDVAGQCLRHKVAAADHVVCISQFARSQLMRLSAPAHWRKLDLCRLGVDTSEYAPRTHAREPGPVRLLCVGRLTPAKGQLLLLQAAGRLRATGLAFELTIVGDGPDRPTLDRALRDLRLSSCVVLAGALNAAEVRAHLARADAFVLPSLAEGIPVVLMEAMASGVACVSCPVNGIPELIEHGVHGLLATPGDVDSLAGELRRLVEDGSLRARLGAAGRARVVDRFDLDRNTSRLASLLRGLPSAGLRERIA